MGLGVRLCGRAGGLNALHRFSAFGMRGMGDHREQICSGPPPGLRRSEVNIEYRRIFFTSAVGYSLLAIRYSHLN